MFVVGGLKAGFGAATGWALLLRPGGWLEADLEEGKRKVPLLAFWLRLESERRDSRLMCRVSEVREEDDGEEDEDEQDEEEVVEEEEEGAWASFSRSCCTSQASCSTGWSMEDGMGWVKA